MATRSFNRRKTLIVDKTAQRRIISAVVVFPMLGLAATTMVVAYYCRRLLAESLQAEADLPSLVPLLVAVLVFFVVCSVLVGVQGLRFSHRIAGPMHRLCKSMERVENGDIGFRVSLRKGDHLTELAASFNRMLDYLNENPPQDARTGSDVVDVSEHLELGDESSNQPNESDLEPVG